MNGSRAISKKNIFDFYAVKKTLLQQSQIFFSRSNNFILQIGIELELYLLKINTVLGQDIAASPDEVENFITHLENFFAAKTAIYKIEKERGEGQVEIKILPQTDLMLLCEYIEEIKIAAKNIAKNFNLVACFEGQPFAEDCGSALQFNFSLHNKTSENAESKNQKEKNHVGENIFIKRDEYFFATIAGMLDSIEFAMIFYAPEEKDYLRFNLEINRNLHKKGKFCAPTNISFGENNRTAAVRVVADKNEDDQKNLRVEFRVAAANADPYLVISALLISMVHAINNKKLLQDSKKIFGNAFDEQYQLKKLPQNLQEAERLFWQEENFIRKTFEDFASV